MHKIKISGVVLCLYFLFSSLYAGDLGSVNGHAVVFEKGDIIYRRGFISNPITYVYGHAGIFYGWPYKAYGKLVSNAEEVVVVNPIGTADSSNRSQYATIEALGFGSVISKTDMSKFLSDGPEFWGVRTANLTRLQRTKIAGTAKNQMGIPFRPLRGYKRPGGGLLFNFQSFRCDGLVEYCYEKAGVDLVPGDTTDWQIALLPGRTFLTPFVQMNSSLLSERTSASVETVELSRVLQNDEVVEPNENDIYYVYDRPGIPDKVTIEVNVSDGNYGSGVRMADFWVGAPDDTPDTFESNDSGKRIGIDAHPETVGGIYKANWNIDEKNQSGNPLFPPGEYTLHILAYDQAGNMGSMTVKVWKFLPQQQRLFYVDCITGGRASELYASWDEAWGNMIGQSFSVGGIGPLGIVGGYGYGYGYGGFGAAMGHNVYKFATNTIDETRVLKTYIVVLYYGSSDSWGRSPYLRAYKASGCTVAGLNEWKTSEYSQCPEPLIEKPDDYYSFIWELPKDMINYDEPTYLGTTLTTEVSEEKPPTPAYYNVSYIEGYAITPVYPPYTYVQLIFLLE